METDNYKVIEPPATFSIHSYIGDLQGCGHIRVIFPSLLLNHLRLNGYNFHASYGSYFINEPRYYTHFTTIQFQRASTEQHLNLIKHYIHNVKKIIKVPITYEIDDLLIDIPMWNRAQEYYEKYKNSIKEILKIVDGITVSTNKLKEVYSEYNSNIVVILNHLPKFLWGDVVFRNCLENKRPRILYQGSDNHFCTKALQNKGLSGGDFGDTLLNYIKKTTDKYQWVFMGGFPLELESDIKAGKIEYHQWQNIFSYPKYIKSLNVDLCIAPLKYNLFNESKSNIKNLEYVALGVPSIYTDIEPYKHTTLKATCEDEMINHIEMVISNKDKAYDLWLSDYDKVKNQLFWENDDNVKKYLNSYLNLFKKKLKD